MVPSPKANIGNRGNTGTRANLNIRVPNVRVINVDGEMLGVMPTREAQRLADSHDLDLVEISPNAEPPVCKIMDFGRFRYEESLKQKSARKSSSKTQLKEVKFGVNVEEHDLQTKLRRIREFISEGHKIKITLQFRGRENAHKELGSEVVNRVIREVEDVAAIEQPPKLMGRVLGCVLMPRPATKPGAKAPQQHKS